MSATKLLVGDIKDILSAALQDCAYATLDHVEDEAEEFLSTLCNEMEGQYDKAIEDASRHIEDMGFAVDQFENEEKFERQTTGERNDRRLRKMFATMVVEAFVDRDLGVKQLKKNLIANLLDANSAERQSRSRCG